MKSLSECLTTIIVKTIRRAPDKIGKLQVKAREAKVSYRSSWDLGRGKGDLGRGPPESPIETSEAPLRREVKESM